MFSLPSYAGWTRVVADTEGNTHYVDFDRIRKQDGYVYFWSITNYVKPSPDGHLSAKVYRQVDCKLFRDKYLNSSYYTEPMGRGRPSLVSNKPDKDWRYPSPNSTIETTLKSICTK